jgi:hypothetical protein
MAKLQSSVEENKEATGEIKKSVAYFGLVMHRVGIEPTTQ